MFIKLKSACKRNTFSVGEFASQLQTGANLNVKYRIRSHVEACPNILGTRSSSVHNCDIKVDEDRRDELILGIYIERVQESVFTGINIRMGDWMTVMFKFTNDGGANMTRLADRLHMV